MENKDLFGSWKNVAAFAGLSVAIAVLYDLGKLAFRSIGDKTSNNGSDAASIPSTQLKSENRPLGNPSRVSTPENRSSGAFAERLNRQQNPKEAHLER